MTIDVSYLFDLKHMTIYLVVTIVVIVAVKCLLWKKIEAPLVEVAARRDLMHLYLGSKEYFTQKGRYLYERRLRGFTTPQLKSAFQKFCYCIYIFIYLY